MSTNIDNINPPWVKMEWNEQAAISDKHPLFVVKGWSAKIE